MTSLILWDVDTQHDFMHTDGKLYVPGAEEIIPRLRSLHEFARQRGIQIIASADDHRPGDAEISDEPDYSTTFPPHCLHGTPGQAKIPETALRDALVVEPELQDSALLRRQIRDHRGDILFHKRRFDVFSNPNVVTVLDEIDPVEIVLFGVALDVCDRYAVEGILQCRPATSLRVVTDAVKPINPEGCDRLVAEWQLRGVELVTTHQVVSGATDPRRSSMTPGHD